MNVEDGRTVSSGFSEYDFSWCVDMILATLVAALSRVPFIDFRIIRIQKMFFVVSVGAF